MMMEDTDDPVVTDDSSHPPDFAMPPGGVQEGDAQSETTSVATPAPADPFDLLSMTGGPPAAAAPAAPVNGFDVFGSAPLAAASAPDLFGGGMATTTNAIDITAQDSMIAPSSSSPKLMTAESGDLLGFAGPAPAPAPPSDFMDSDFQSMPLASYKSATADPFGNSDMFQPVPAAAATTDSLLNMATQQPALGGSVPNNNRAVSPVRALSPVPTTNQALSPKTTSPLRSPSGGKAVNRFSFSEEIAKAKEKTLSSSSPSKQRSVTPPRTTSSPPRQRSVTPPRSNVSGSGTNGGANSPSRQPQSTTAAKNPSTPPRPRSQTPPPAAANTKNVSEQVAEPKKATPSLESLAMKSVEANKTNEKGGEKTGENSKAKVASTLSKLEQEKQAQERFMQKQKELKAAKPAQTEEAVPESTAPAPKAEEADKKESRASPANPASQAAPPKVAPSAAAAPPPKEGVEEANPPRADAANAPAKDPAGPTNEPANQESAPAPEASITAAAAKNVEVDPLPQEQSTASPPAAAKATEEPTATGKTDLKAENLQVTASPTENKTTGDAKVGTTPEPATKEATAQEEAPKQAGTAADSDANESNSKGREGAGTRDSSESKNTVPEQAAKPEAQDSTDTKSEENGQTEETRPDEDGEFEDVGFEEVELVSPQVSRGLDSEAKEASEAAKSKAVATGALKPPDLSTNNNPAATQEQQKTANNQAAAQEQQSANDQLVAKTKEELAAEVQNRERAERLVKALEEQLATAKTMVQNLQDERKQLEQRNKDSQAGAAKVLKEIQSKLQQEQNQRAEAENESKRAKKQLEGFKTSLQEREEQWNLQSQAWTTQLTGLEKENEALIAKAKQELEDRKEHERRERVLQNKLNTLKKQQASKTDVEDVYEDDLRLLKDDVSAKTKLVEELQASEASLKEQLEREKTVSNSLIEQLENAVREEKQLNEDRKKKMKAFIESKAEELREAKADSENYSAELNRNNQSQVDLNNRWKTLHAQWVQSQTRNRELQRDLNKMKKDAENMHKVGDTLNSKLSRSANDIEQHKNKRLAAKQELMSVLGKLEAEREITNKLRDSVRFTFTSKAQSQHQLLQEALTEFNKQLEALARRLGRPIPLTSGGPQSLSSLVMSAVDESEVSEGDDAVASGTNGGQEDGQGGASKEQKRIMAETTRLLAKLEAETQHISQGIMTLSNAIEQMNILINGGGEKTCFTSLGDIFFGGGMAKAKANSGGSAPVRYGHSSTMPTQSGTMT